MNLLLKILTIIFGICAIVSCSSKKTDYESVVFEWTGKKIVFPDSMEIVGGGYFTKAPSDFTIVSYYNSKGCTGCRMKLAYWNEFMENLDSIAPEINVDLVLIANNDNDEYYSELISKSGFRYKLLMDKDNHFNETNHLPEDELLHTFLLNSLDEVISIGNPIGNTSMMKVYMDMICDLNYNLDSDANNNILSHDFGDIKFGERVSHTFRLKNQSEDTLIIKKIMTSCECVKAVVIPDIIYPNSEFKVVTSFQDTTKGKFERSISVLFSNKIPEFQFELSGVIITK